MKKRILSIILAVILICCLTVSVFADYSEGYFYYTVENESVTITGCFGRQEELTVPSMIAGCPVNHIASGAFVGNKYLKVVNLPDTIMSIEEGAFDPSITVNMASPGTETETTEPSAEPTVQPTAEPESKQSETSAASSQPKSTSAPAANSTAAPTASTSPTPTPRPTGIIVIQGGSDSEGEMEDTLDDDEEEETEESAEDEAEEVEDSGDAIDAAAPTGSTKPAETEETAATGQQAQEQAGESKTSPAPFIAAGVLLAAAIAAAVIVLKKKKQ